MKKLKRSSVLVLFAATTFVACQKKESIQNQRLNKGCFPIIENNCSQIGEFIYEPNYDGGANYNGYLVKMSTGNYSGETFEVTNLTSYVTNPQVGQVITLDLSVCDTCQYITLYPYYRPAEITCYGGELMLQPH